MDTQRIASYRREFSALADLQAAGTVTYSLLREADAFVSHHRSGSFMQSPAWAKVKPNWKHEIVARRGPDGKLKGTMSILIMPMGPGALMYAPRGPVCDSHDEVTLASLMQGARRLAKERRGFTFKLDPDIKSDDVRFCDIMKKLGFVLHDEGKNFEGIQPRYVFRLPVKGKTEEELLNSFESKWRCVSAGPKCWKIFTASWWKPACATILSRAPSPTSAA